LLAEDRKWANKLGIVIHPTVTVNNVTYRGEINGYNVFKAICAGFKDYPIECKGDNVFAIIESGEEYKLNHRHLHHFA